MCFRSNCEDSWYVGFIGSCWLRNGSWRKRRGGRKRRRERKRKEKESECKEKLIFFVFIRR